MTRLFTLLICLFSFYSAICRADPEDIDGIDFGEERLVQQAYLHPQRSLDGSIQYKIMLKGIFPAHIESALKNLWIDQKTADLIKQERDKLREPGAPEYYRVPRTDGTVSIGAKPIVRLRRGKHGIEIAIAVTFLDGDESYSRGYPPGELKPFEMKPGEVKEFYVPRGDGRYTKVRGISLNNGIVTIIQPGSYYDMGRAERNTSLDAETCDIDITQLKATIPRNSKMYAFPLTPADHVSNLQKFDINTGADLEQSLAIVTEKVEESRARAEEAALSNTEGKKGILTRLMALFQKGKEACARGTEIIGLTRPKAP